MSLIPPAQNESTFQLLPAGQHKAQLTMICDLGMQPGYQGGKEKHQVYVRWTTDLKMENSEFNFSLGQFYTLSLGEYNGTKSNLRKMLEQWRGRAFTDDEVGKFDLVSVLGKFCTLMVVHAPKQNGEMKAVLAGITPLKDPIVQPDPVILYDQTDPNCEEVYKTLPEWLQNKIPVPASSFVNEGTHIKDDSTPIYDDREFNDDIPF